MALRSMLRRGAHRVWGRLNHGAVVTRGPGGWKLRVAPDGYEDLRYWLRYEAATAELLRRELKTEWQILDIGAHHGVFGVCCAPSLPSRLVAVEPSPQALPLLEANARAQPGARWEVVRAAVGAAPGRMQLYPGLIHMLVSDPRLHPGAAARPLEVEVTTVDTLCRARGLRPDLIKLDVEAYEAEALAGAAETLAQGPASSWSGTAPCCASAASIRWRRWPHSPPPDTAVTPSSFPSSACCPPASSTSCPRGISTASIVSPAPS